MKKDKILESMEYIDAEIINEADNYAPAKKKNSWLKWGAMAACFCLILVGAFGTNKYFKHLPQDHNPVEDIGDAVDGLYIPSVELPKRDEGEQADMIGLVVYNSGIYTHAENYYGDSAIGIDALVGDYLGYASGSINEWSKQEEYAENFASTMSGKVYSVKGYDTDFRICIRKEIEDENGEPTLWILFLDRLNGITLTRGEDLFESKLHIRNRVKSIQWQSHDDWDWGRGNIQDVNLDSACWEEFLNQIDNSKFVYAWADDNHLSDSNGTNKSIYHTPNQAHLILTMEDGTVVRLRLIEGGYVGYDALGWYFVQIPGETFDAVYGACGGTYIG